MRARSALRLRLAAGGFACVVTALAGLAPAPARADCLPSGPNAVTCAPPGTGGYVATSDGVTVTVQPGATVNDDGTQGISLNNTSAVTNNGTVNAASAFSTGIVLSGTGNTVTIGTTGVIAVTGDYATGINSNGANQITNNGTIYVSGLSDSSTHSVGIASGPNVGGVNDTITNNGTVWVTVDNAIGIFGFNGQPTIFNTGMVNVTAGGIGIWAGADATLTNTGTVTASGTGAYGVEFDSNGAGTFTNSGTVSATGGNAEALHIRGLGAFNPIGIINNGTLQATGAGSYALRSQSAFGFAPSGATITNNGTIDGRIDLGAGGDTLTNAGLITVTSGNIPLGTVFSITDGAFVQTATGTLALRVGSAASSKDILSITNGGATLAGSLKAVVQPGLYASTTSYLGVITTCGICGAVSGTFSSVAASSPFFTTSATYNATTVDLTLTRIAFNAIPGLTPNQQTVADVLEHNYSTSLTGNAAALYGNLLAGSSAAGSYDQLSGAGTAAAQNAAFDAGGLFNATMLQQGLAWLTGAPGGGGFGAPLQYAAADKPKRPGYEAFAAMGPRQPEVPVWRAWALGFGATHRIDGGSGTAAQSMQAAGGAFGVERTLGPDLLVGLAAGGSGSTFSVSSLSTSGQIDAGHFGGYAAKRWGDVYGIATINYARLDNTTDRTITGVGSTETAHGRFAGDQLGGRFELGWRRQMPGYAVTPFVAVEPAALWQHAYSETSTTAAGGAGVLGLNYAAHETTSLPTFAGAQLDGAYALGNGQTVRPFLRAAWVHEFMPQRQIDASFASIPSASFTVDGARPASDAARVTGGATWTLDASRSLFARVDSEVSGSGTMVAGTAGARVTW